MDDIAQLEDENMGLRAEVERLRFAAYGAWEDGWNTAADAAGVPLPEPQNPWENDRV